MKALLTFCLALFSCIGISHAQTILYSQTFESSYSEWTLNTTDLGGDASLAKNQWIINNAYDGGGLFTTTPDEISPITNFPESYYLHITSALNISSGNPNDCFNTGGAAATYIAVMNTPIVTTGHANDTLSFWWLCKGSANAVGKVYYRTGAANPWLQITSGFCTDPISIYNLSGTTWTQQKVYMDSFDNAPFLEFAFQFTKASGNDPSFAVDDIMLYTASPSSSVASFTTSSGTACQDSCITATSTTTGTPDSVRWSSTGGTIASPTATVTSVCFPTAGTYTITLTAYGGGSSTTANNVVNVTPTPDPVIINNAGTHTLSVTGAYTSYQWASGSPIPSAISGATNSTYTYSVSGTYYVGVDSAGCPGYSTVPFVYTSTAVSNINSVDNTYRIAGTGNAITLYASKPLDEALTINIYDATGRSIVGDMWTAGNITKQIDNTSFPPGLYIIRLSNKNSATVLRFIR